MTKLTIDQVRASLERIIQEKGADYKYQPPGEVLTDCWYADPNDGTPSCIVGHVFADLAPDLFAALRELERNVGESYPVDDLPDNSIGYRALDYLTPEVTAGLAQAQLSQDTGGVWGLSVQEFDRGVMAYRELHR